MRHILNLYAPTIAPVVPMDSSTSITGIALRTEVKNQLSQFVVVRYNAEKPNESPAKEVLNQFGVIGLPAYVVRQPQR